MPLINVLSDVKPWVGLGIILALLIGFDHPDAASILMVVLIAQMTVSLDGIKFARDDFKTYSKSILGCVVCCFLINTAVTLLTGLLFIDNTQLWYGWVMLASMPCAVSVVVASLVMKGDAKLSVLGLTVIYLVAIALTPILTHTILGSAVNPLEVLKYILMFIAIPFILSVPIKKLHLRRTPKTLFINLMLMLMVFIGLGSRREYLFGEPDVVLTLIVANLGRIFLLGFILVYAMKAAKMNRERSIVYLVTSIWRNSGMSISMGMALFGATMPDVVLPCVLSLVMEAAWFAIMDKLIDIIWPPENSEALPSV